MAKGLVIYHSRSGNTKEMAEIIAKAMNEADLPSECKSVNDITPEELFIYDAIVIGSPTYYGQMAGPIKSLIDELVSRHGQLDGKVGAAFSSAANMRLRIAIISTRLGWSLGNSSRTSTIAIAYQPMARLQKFGACPVSLLAHFCSRLSSQA